MFGGGFWIAGWAMKCGMNSGRSGVDWGVECKRVEAGRRLVAGEKGFGICRGRRRGNARLSLVLSQARSGKVVQEKEKGLVFNRGRALEWRI